jgi:prevent-host-death family protein
VKTLTVSIAEGKKSFSSIVRSTAATKADVVVTNRGKPVAVIVPYEGYLTARRLDGYRKILAAREVFAGTGLKSSEILASSRKELEKRS